MPIVLAYGLGAAALILSLNDPYSRGPLHMLSVGLPSIILLALLVLPYTPALLKAALLPALFALSVPAETPAYLIVGLVTALFEFASRRQRAASVIAWLTVSWWLVYRHTQTFNDRPATGLWLTALSLFGLAATAGWVIRGFNEREAAVRAEAEHLRMTYERARRELLQQLHDGLARDLSMITVFSEVAARTTDPAESDRARAAVLRLAREGIADVDRLITVLRPEGDATRSVDAVEERDISAAADHAAATLRDLGQHVELDIAVHDDLPAVLAGLATRAIRESTANIAKHATTARVSRITIRSDARELHVEIRNDGLADRPDYDAGSHGLGLPSLAERTRLLGGRCIYGVDGEHWVLRLNLPIHPRHT